MRSNTHTHTHFHMHSVIMKGADSNDWCKIVNGVYKTVKGNDVRLYVCGHAMFSGSVKVGTSICTESVDGACNPR